MNTEKDSPENTPFSHEKSVFNKKTTEKSGFYRLSPKSTLPKRFPRADGRAKAREIVLIDYQTATFLFGVTRKLLLPLGKESGSLFYIPQIQKTLIEKARFAEYLEKFRLEPIYSERGYTFMHGYEQPNPLLAMELATSKNNEFLNYAECEMVFSMPHSAIRRIASGIPGCMIRVGKTVLINKRLFWNYNGLFLPRYRIFLAFGDLDRTIPLCFMKIKAAKPPPA